MKLLTFEHNGKKTRGVLDDEGMVVAQGGWKTLTEVQHYTQTARKSACCLTVQWNGFRRT